MEKANRRYLILILALCGVLAFASVASAAVTNVRCIVWQGDPAKYHTAISTQAAQLKAVIDANATSAIYYKWIYGDGTQDATASTLSGSLRYNVTVNHTYTAAVGTPFTATLVVANDSGLATGVIQDTYLIKIEDAGSIDAKINIAIDKGLWWLYQQGGTHSYANYPQTFDGSPQMTWLQQSYVYTLATPTAAAVHAFGINGHKIKNNPNQDPYVEAVQKGMNYLIKGYNYYPDYAALRAYSISPPRAGEDPDGNSNGYGVQVYDWANDHAPYQIGGVMDAIMASGVAPGDLTGRDFTKIDGTVPKNWTYGELIQDMVDMNAWGQWDGSGCNGGICGSWWYNWNYSSPGDNSASQWPVIGMIPAQQPPWNATLQAWVKNYNANWLAYSMGCSGPSSAVTSCGYSFFSYNGVGGCAADSCLQTTPSGMVQMIFAGQTTADLKWTKGSKYIFDQWQRFTHGGSNYGPAMIYGWYSFAKAMRLSLPTPTTQAVKTSGASFDWYYGNPANDTCTNEANCEQGLAPRILEIQNEAGYWPAQLGNEPLDTAWMIITLKPALFAAAPIACFDYNPKATYSGDTVTFNPSCSGHSEAGKSIANLTKFEWDWNNDGNYDVSSTTPSIQTQAFNCASLPCTFPVTLRVTDDASPALTATAKQNVIITNPPHPPVADAGGPYMVSLCTNDSLALDGSKSFDPDEGLRQDGCTACAFDTITAYGWDLVPPLTGFADKTGKNVAISGGSGAGQVGSYFTAGAQQIGLRVTDNTALAFPGSGQPNLTDAKFAGVQVYAAGICNLVARAKSGKIQLTWSNTGAASYDVYRSTAGPNTGFVKIKSGLVNSYATYLDETVVNGTKYYYRVVDNTTGGGSNVANATASAR